MMDEELVPLTIRGDVLEQLPGSAMARFYAPPSFLAEYFALTVQERARFRQAWQKISLALDTTGQLPPPPLVDKMTGKKKPVIYEVRWDQSSANKRATFHLEQDAQGQPVVVWRRIGDHHIYINP